MRYNVSLAVAGTATIEIEADSPELAQQAAIENFNKDFATVFPTATDLALQAGDTAAVTEGETAIDEATMYTTAVTEA